jgi:hypothetical protein
MSKDKAATCMSCDCGSDLVPLIRLAYRSASLWICPEHLPIRIPDPGRLVGKLAGADHFRRAEHRH